MKKETLRKTLTGFAALCYIIFLLLDFLMPSAWEVSSAIKYAGLLACATIAILGGDGTLRAALLLTAACDYLLLFTQSFLPGVLAFACAQLLHVARCARLADVPAKFSVYPAAGAAVVLGAILCFASGDPLLAASAAYALLLLTATALAFVALARGRGDGNAVRFTAAGMGLFVLCDVCVAAFNLGYHGAGPWMWAFYLPSQWLLAYSEDIAEEPEPPMRAERRT